MTGGATAVALALALSPAAGAADTERPHTFNRDVAPIVFSSCSTCHRPGEAAPFSLLTYRDVRAHAEQIVEVTTSRFMPPWLPLPGYGEFEGNRRLADEQLAVFREWYEDGAPEGDPADLPPPPQFTAGWRLGTPDLVIELAEPYELAAEGTDVIRNLVIPVPTSERHFVRAVELRPGNKRVVHHAVLKTDRTHWSRRLDERDPAPGFGGMRMGNAEAPDGHVIVWTPGSRPYVAVEGTAWTLEPGTDFVLQLHMVPGGKPERIASRIGLYYTDEPPTLETFSVMLREDRIDIPPGVSDYAIEDSFLLPVGVDVLSIYPHAHYLGKTMDVQAVDSRGRRRWLLRIDDWDFNWQGMYRYVEPVHLEAGTTVSMRYTYDNSTDNVRNPNYPPKRVVAGNRSEDEMGNLVLQVVPTEPGTLSTLREAQWRKMLEDDPNDPAALYNMAVEYAKQNRYTESARFYERVIEIDPRDEAALYSLASVYFKLGDRKRAATNFKRVTTINPRNAEAHLLLGWILVRQGEAASAEDHLRKALEVDPALAPAHAELGSILARRGELTEAERHFSRALAIDPGLAAARQGLDGIERRRQRR